jgi:CRP-like cAMP-binding protein
MAQTDLNIPGQNRLLALLPRTVARRMDDVMEQVSLGLKEMLYEADAPIEHVYFPISGMMSVVITMEDGGTVEVGTIGNEGMIGTPLYLGAARSPTRAFSQIPGDCLRMTAANFKRELTEADEALHRLIGRYCQAFVNQISQSVACNHLHSVEERSCRWLLMAHDRVGKDEFPLTQEFLSQMLGVRRPSVTIAAGLLEKAGLITYKRGRITVLNRDGLEAASCECYGVVNREYERLLGTGAGTPERQEPQARGAGTGGRRRP